MPSRSPPALRYFYGNKLVGDRFPCRRRFLRLRDGRHRDVKQGEQQLSDPVRLFQMRIAGKDKAIDTQRGVFTLILSATVAASPTSAVPAPPRAKPTPAHRLGLISSLSRRPLCRGTPSLLANGVGSGESRLGAGDRLVVKMGEIRLSAACHASSLVSPDDHVQTDAKTHLATMPGGFLSHLSLFSLPPGPAVLPGKIKIDLLSGQLPALPQTSRRNRGGTRLLQWRETAVWRRERA